MNDESSSERDDKNEIPNHNSNIGEPCNPHNEYEHDRAFQRVPCNYYKCIPRN